MPKRGWSRFSSSIWSYGLRHCSHLTTTAILGIWHILVLTGEDHLVTHRERRGEVHQKVYSAKFWYYLLQCGKKKRCMGRGYGLYITPSLSKVRYTSSLHLCQFNSKTILAAYISGNLISKLRKQKDGVNWTSKLLAKVFVSTSCLENI